MRFTELSPRHYPLLKPFFSNQPFRQSIFCLPLVIVWRNESGFKVRFAIRKEVLYMTAENRERPELDHLALPLPVGSHGPEELATLARTLGFRRYGFVPEGYFELHERAEVERHFAIAEREDYEDYLYLAEDLAGLKGHRYSKKRNLIAQFEKAFVDQGRVSVEPISPGNLPACRAFLDRWFSRRYGEAHPSGKDDALAAYETLEHFFALEFQGLAIRVDRDVSALGAAARLSEDTGVETLNMAFAECKGLYQFLDRECARRLFLGRFRYINKESDMGVPGIRQAKRSCHPVKRVKCFNLSLREQSSRG